VPCGGAAWMSTAGRDVRPVRLGRPRKAQTEWHTVRARTTPDAAWHLPGSHSSGPPYAGHSPLQRATARLRAEALVRAKARPADLSAAVPPDEGG